MSKTKTNKLTCWSRRGIVILLPCLALALVYLLTGGITTAQAIVNLPTGVCVVKSAAYPTIQSAVDDAICVEIYVPAGIYQENVIINRSLSMRGAGTGLTIVDGTRQGSVFTCSDHSDANITLADMRIQGGAADDGGGIHNGSYCWLTGENLEVIGNSAEIGGGISNWGVMTITHSSITGNTANTAGGINSWGFLSSYLTMSDSEVRSNFATGPGGGMYISSAAIIDQVTCIGNASEDNGGCIWAGVANQDLSLPILISNSLIRDNIAELTGGIVVANQVTIDASEIISNTGGRSQFEGNPIYGGGIRVMNSAALTLTNSIVSHNILDPIPGYTFALIGGGIYVNGSGGRLFMVNTTVTHNFPGGISDGYDSIQVDPTSLLEIKGSTISNNIGHGLSGIGNLTVSNSQVNLNTQSGINYTCTGACPGIVTLRHSWVTQNGSHGVGGVDVTINHSIIQNNGGHGVSGDSLYMQFSTISGNHNPDEGGGVTGEDIEIRSSTISTNQSDLDGGGIFATGSLLVVNSTVSGNTALGSGGGIALIESSASATLDGVTVAGNTADLDADDSGDGGGLYRAPGAGDFSVSNTIIANNQDNSPVALHQKLDCSGDFIGGWSLVEEYDNVFCTGFGGALNVRGQDPQISALADNGGPTWTHALGAASPALGFIIGANCETYDQRGVVRDTTNFCDIGAYERSNCAAPVQPTLAITGDERHIQLNWDRRDANREVEIWRGTDPFDINTFSNTWVNLSADTAYLDYDAIGNHLENYFYAVRGQNACGAYSAFSNRVGEYDFNLAEQDATQIMASTGVLRVLHFALVSLPLEGVSLPTSADEVAAYIDPTGNVRGVAKWNPLTHSWVVRRVGSPFGTPDFSVVPGDVLLLGMTAAAPKSFAWVGDVPAAGSLQNNLQQGVTNFIIVPLDQSGEFVLTADGLAANIGGVTAVGAWSTAQQRWYLRIVGLSGIDFPIRPGYPYAIHIPVDAGIPPVWP